VGQLELKTYPDPCLRIRTKTVEKFNSDIAETLRAMASLMHESHGIGLAATQVGLGLSILVIDPGDGLINMINPEILDRSKEKTYLEEGCLSLPGLTVNVKRSKTVKIRACDENGNFFVKTFDDLGAKAVQHEMDHLKGILIMDYLNPIMRFVAGRKIISGRNAKKTCEVTCNE